MYSPKKRPVMQDVDILFEVCLNEFKNIAESLVIWGIMAIRWRHHYNGELRKNCIPHHEHIKNFVLWNAINIGKKYAF